jgi:ribosomal protein S18 acetylase RimI-like enzyme
VAAIRAAQPCDIPALLALVRRYWEFEGIAGFEALRIERVLQQLLDPARGAIWVAADNAGLRGYLIVVLLLSVEHQGLMGEIDELFVVSEARGQGLGGQLLRQAQAALSARGCTRLQLQLAQHNAAARAFYEHHGYAARAGFGLMDRALR